MSVDFVIYEEYQGHRTWESFSKSTCYQQKFILGYTFIHSLFKHVLNVYYLFTFMRYLEHK